MLVAPDCPRQICEEQHVERDQKERVDGHTNTIPVRGLVVQLCVLDAAVTVGSDYSQGHTPRVTSCLPVLCGWVGESGVRGV